jgi:hypothetical protein
MAIPSKPRKRPIIEAAKERKFKKKVDSRTLITIKKGATAPNNTRINPIRIRDRGLLREIIV